MIKRLRNLSISRALFLITISIVGFIMLISSFITYSMIFTRTNLLIETTSKEINKQVVLNYENYFNNVIDKSNVLQKYILTNTKDQEIDVLKESFISSVNLEKNILTVALFDTLGNVISSSSDSAIATSITDKSWFIQAINQADIHHFSNPHIEEIYDTNKEVFSISKSVQYYDSLGNSKNGVLLINIDTTDFRALASMTNLGIDGHIVITDFDDDLIFSSKDECDSNECSSIQVINDIILGGRLIKLDNLSMFVNVNTIKNTRWRIATFINVDNIANTKVEVLITVALIFGGTMIATAISSAAFATRITHPLNMLENHIKVIEKGDFDTRVTVEGQKEVVLLAEAFNKMSNHVKNLMNEIVQEQHEKRKTQFIALQNQINPHFLYNTLDAIVSLSETQRNKDVERAIIALSKFFRMSISDEKNIVTLKDEVEHVSSYLLIQQIRYHNTFMFDFEIDENVFNKYVLKLSLQPLVENAIIHGIKPDESFTKILVKGYEIDNFIYIEVINEGYGISPEKLDEIHQMIRGKAESTSIGLKNVYQRLKLYYGESADLYLNSVLDEFTVVTMKIPETEGLDL
ncbi:MAG: sensor histidine kinase [Acholeplasmataceae bacterium]|nr:sensor histidine kinase [Acholeplasmataceae bacterium]